MELKFISQEAYIQLMKKMDEIILQLDNSAALSPLNEIWLDVQEVCILLKISKRTLQHYRDNGMLPFSQISGKIYFKASDLQKHLEDNYHK